MTVYRYLFHATLLMTILTCAGYTSGLSSTSSFPGGYIQVDGGRLYYEAAGEGEAIVLIHDGLLHRETWNLEFDQLARDYRVIRYDRRGYGRSTPPEQPFSNVEDLHEIFRALSVERAMLIGMSAGGRLAVDYTLAYPEQVTSLVLVGPVVSGMGFTNHFFDRSGRLTQDIMANRERWGRFYVAEDPYSIAPQNQAARELATRLLEANPHNFDAVNTQLAQPPERPAIERLSAIAVPTLIAVGEYDIADVHAHAGALEAGIPGSQRVIVRGAAHFVPMEQPETLLSLVQSFRISGRFNFILRTQSVAEAIDYFHSLREEDPNVVPFEENAMNQEAYSYLFQGQVEEATALFKLIVAVYPDSWNAYDSLGEALLTAGDRSGAEANYRKSLELNPGNSNAVRVLESMGVKIGD
ncbi:MAG: alpha/beta fold hydrolase [Fidelibacterota bacterium]|nr:MAG: alpha/beta fold hydrolase [Candidatus Neomarinimicrobiota bacterium]